MSVDPMMERHHQQVSGSEGRDALAMLVTAEEAAGYLHVSRTKVFELIRAGALRSLKVGGSRRITAEALREYVALREAS